MHDTADLIGKAFLKKYSKARQIILEVGALDINGSIRRYAHPEAHYVGIDIEPGRGVDVVCKQGEELPFTDCSVDIVLATSVFEHDSFFWLTFLDLVRVVKPGGVVYINAPSNGTYHRHPNDNWRFYPDAGKTLEAWGRKSGFDLFLIESFIAERKRVWWNDFVAIFQRASVSTSPIFISGEFDCTNVWRLGATQPMRERKQSEDLVIIERLGQQVEKLKQEINEQNIRIKRLTLPLQHNHEIEMQKSFVEELKRHFQPTRLAEQRLAELLKKYS